MYEITTPDGRTLVVGWISLHGVWRAKLANGAEVHEGKRFADAVAAASDDPGDADWILQLERELESLGPGWQQTAA